MNWIRCFFTVWLLKQRSRRIVDEAMHSSTPPDDSPYLKSGWQLSPGSVKLPEWFKENRIHGHTRLLIHHPRWGLDTSAFQSAGVKLKELGAEVYARHVKTCSHSPWWPTAVPVGPTGDPLWNGVIGSCETGDPVMTIPEGRNVVQEMVDEAHAAGVRLLAYYWHMSERVVSDLHPEWVCKDLDCTTVIDDTREGPWLDLTEPDYREIVLQRLLELAGLGVDGFYFDFRHMPKDGSWCSALADAFTVETGTPPPSDKDLDNQIYRQFLDFRAYKIEEAFAYWKGVVKNQFPQVVFVISTTGIPVPHNRYETTNLVRLADSAKNEYKLALALDDAETFFDDNGLAEPERDIRQAFGWVLLRDSADGRPPHIWERSFANRDHTLAATSAMITYGTIANMNVDERILAELPPSPVLIPREVLEETFSLGNQVSPYLAHSRPVRWAAVHFSELARNRRGGDLRLAWQEVLWPTVGAFGGFIRAGISADIVNDYQLEHGQLKGYQILFLPNPNELTSAQKDTIHGFVSQGGILLKNNPGWLWSDPDTTGDAAQAFQTELRPVIRCFAPSVQVLSSAERIHGVTFEDKRAKRLVVAVTNDFSWIQWVSGNDPIDPEDIHPSPPPISDAEVLVKKRNPPLDILEVLSGTPLVYESIPQGYKVRLPLFSTMALLVVQE